MMIQNTTFLRRAVGSLLVALVTLVGFQANAQSVDFTASADFTFAEDAGNGGTSPFNGGSSATSIADLNSRINAALPSTNTDYCYAISGNVKEFELTEGNECRFDGQTPDKDAGMPAQGRNGTIGVSLKAGMHLDADPLTGGDPNRTLIVTGYAKKAKKGALTVNITIKPFDEQPLTTQKAADIPVWYIGKNDSESILISSLFMDPEGAPVYFNAAATSTDVYVCDSDMGGNRSPADSTIADNTRDQMPADAGTPTPGVGGPGTVACSVSNENAEANGAPGTAGNRVITTRKVGPILHITADSLVIGKPPVDRSAGTYSAHVFFRVWSGGASNRLASADWAQATVHVKVGANNVPQFAGGATGYVAEISEGSGVTTTGGMAAWVARDLDTVAAGGATTNDMLEYSLEGQFFSSTARREVVLRAGGVVWATYSPPGDPDATPPVPPTIALWGKGLDYENAESFTVNLQVTDNWSEPVSVPITVSVKNVNELNFVKKLDGKTDNKIKDQKMVNGLSRTFDLDDYFYDPEGDTITYSAHSNIYTDIVALGEGNMLTVTGGHATESTDSVVSVTITASDGKGATLSDTFTVTSRYSNDAPKITVLESGTVAVGTDSFEADSAGTELLMVAYSDDDPNPTAHLSGASADLFTAVVKDDHVVVSVGEEDLNFEAASRHVIHLTLQDSWDETVMSDSLEIQINVNDSNDAPTVKEDAEIADQSIVVNGSGSLYTGDHFEDEDGDRLLIDAVSSDMTKVYVSVSGLDGVKFSGVAETEEDSPVVVTLTAKDPDGESATLSFNVSVGANNAPVADAEAFAAALPENNTINVGATADIDLDGLFSEPDTGDEITSITASTSDEDTLLVVSTNDGHSITLVGRASGMATLTITAMDGGGNSTSESAEITVNEAPAEAKPIDPVEMDRVTPHVVDVSSVFTDGDDGVDMLTITAEAVGEGMDRVTLEIMDGQLTITGVLGVMPGDVEILLTATDPHGATATSSFVVSVINVGPTVAMSLEDQEMDRTMPLTLDLSGVFMDADGEMLTISAEVQDATIVELGDVDVDDASMLMVTALAVGATSVVLTAVDEDGATIMADFEVSVINIAPVVAEAVPDQSTTRADDLMIDVSGTFNDPDAANELLTITVSVANAMYVSAMLDDTTLTLSGLDVGTSAITLTATDADGGMVETTFDTTIDNVAPVVANSISPIVLEVGGQAASQSISGLFTDDDDMLTYTVTSSNSGIASASLTGMTAMVAPASRGSTEITVTATDPHGASASVMGSVTVGDGELKAVAAKSLAGFGRAMLASVSSSVGSRLMNDARSSDLTLDAWAPVENNGTMSADDRSEVAWNTVTSTNTASTAGASSALQAGPLSGVDALRSTFGQSFALNLGSTDNRSNWSVWGDIDRQSYEGAGYDGTASSIYLGADVTVAECWMFGVAVSTNTGESDYTYGTATQTMDMSLTTVLPYVSYQPSHGSSIWGVAGFGSGELETTVVGAGNETSDLTTQLTLVGGSQDLTRLGRMNLALRGDAAVASIETEDGNGAADGLTADVNRIRIGLEGSLRSDTGNGGTFEPFGQVSLRSDGGDGDTGTGVEIAGGIRLTSNTLTLEAQGRTLAMHGADEYNESGFSLMAKLNPSASATGVSVSIAPRWGADAMGNGMLWQDTLNLNSAQTYGALAGFGNAGANKSIDTQIGYGMLVANEQFLLTPFVDLGVSDSDRREMLFGLTLQQMVDGNSSLDVNLALGRVEERTGASSGKIGLNATLRF